MESVSSASEKIVGRLLIAEIRQLLGMLSNRDSIYRLRKQVNELEDLSDRLRGKIDAAISNGETIKDEVKAWMAEADVVISEADKFLEAYATQKIWCLRGWCILRSSNSFSKEAQRMIQAIIKLLNEGNFETLSHFATHRNSGTFESRKLIMQQIMEALEDDNVNIIGICGVGGVGKTTLLKEIGEKVKEEKQFNAIAMAAVSQTPSVMKIQREIADMLGLELSDDNELARSAHLWERIKEEKRILVFLDDVWGRIEMKRIGIPSGVDCKGCKIIFTSQSEAVCNEMAAEKIFSIGILSEQESWMLFREAAGPNVDAPDIKPIAMQIAAKCGGLPVAILIAGRALSNKRKKHDWINAARQLKKSTPTNILGLHQNTISTLELSFNCLESEEAKSFFLFCCLFPEDYSIPLEDMVRYAMGLKLFKDVETLVEARKRAEIVVSILTSSFLLISDDGQKCVKLHDVVRNFALTLAPKHKHMFMVKAGIGLQEWPFSVGILEDLTGISLMSNSIQELPDRLECPKLQALLLQKNSALVVPDNFFQGMKDLKVLDLSNTELLPLPLSIQLLTNLRSLCLNGCKLHGLSVIGNLTNLEILSLSYSDIIEIPIDFDKLTHLKLFDLTYCKRLTFISYGVISCLHKLEELYMRGSFDGWDLEREGDSTGNAKVIELQALSYLTSLHICVPNVSTLPNKMPFHTLTSFTIGIGVTSFELRKFQSPDVYSRNMMLSNDMRSSVHFDWVKSLMKSTENMIFIGVINSENILNDLITLASQEFNNLKSLTLINCKEVKYLLNTLELTAPVIFKELEVLQIDDSPMFEMCRGQLPAESFNKVKKLEVRQCHNVLNIVPSHLLQSLQNLETFEASDCESLVHVFDLERHETVTAETKLLSSMKQLTLCSLPKVTHIWKGDTQAISLNNLKSIGLNDCKNLTQLFASALLQSLISLEVLMIEECDKLEEVFGEKEAENHQDNEIVPLKKDHTPSSPSLQNLSFVYINHCDRLKTLFTPSICKTLVLLKRLEVSWCEKMEEIIANQEGEAASKERIVFPRLYYMKLEFLDNLTCFFSGLSMIEFPVLEDLKIVACPKMKIFSYGVQATPLLRKVKQFYMNNEGQWKGNLNDTVEHFFNEEALIQEQHAMLPELPEDVSIESSL